MFGALYAAEGSSAGTLMAVAREFSPRMEAHEPRTLVLDLSGLTELFGDARTIGEELRRTAADHGLRVRVAIAGTRTAARLLVHHRAGLTVVAPGAEAAALAPLPIELLRIFANPEPGTEPGTSEPGTEPRTRNLELRTFRRWGLRTLGAVAALPAGAVAARLGQDGARWQRYARGEDARPLIPACPEERFEEALDLEWPIEGLEPLSFVLGRLLEPLSAHLERRGRGAAVVHLRLHLVTRAVHERSLHLPAPLRDARALRTLVLLDLESHPPPAAIDRVVVAVDPTPGRVIQYSLLARPLPSPERLSTLMARLTALMGEGRCGTPAVVDTWQPGAFVMKPFAPLDSRILHRDGTPRRRDTEVSKRHGVFESLGASVPRCSVEANDVASQPTVALRRFRHPVPARVRVERGTPVRVDAGVCEVRGGRVEVCAGPWRTSGGWWSDDGPRRHGGTERNLSGGQSWDRDEWDVTLGDGVTYRVFRERGPDAWFIEGIVD